MARIFRRLAQLLDVDLESTPPAGGDALTYDDVTDTWIPGAGGGGGGVTDADFLVGTAHAGLSAEIVVGATPGGELGGTWASPTVDTTHSGSSHASVQAAAEATASADLDLHEADTTNVHGITNTANLSVVGHAHAGEDITSGTVADARIASTIARDSEVTSAISTSESGQVRDGDAAGGVLGGTYPNPSFAADMATQAELDAHVNDTSAAHAASAISFSPTGTVAATDVQAAIAEVASEAGGIAATIFDAKGDIIAATAADTAARLAVGGTNGMVLTVASAQSTGLAYALPPGTELSYVEFTSNVTVNATVEASANTIATAASITLDGSTSVVVECFTPAAICGSGGQTVFTLWDGSTDLGRIGQQVTPGAQMWQPLVIHKRINNPSNGSHQYIWKAWRVSADGTIAAGAGSVGVFVPGYIRVVKV